MMSPHPLVRSVFALAVAGGICMSAASAFGQAPPQPVRPPAAGAGGRVAMRPAPRPAPGTPAGAAAKNGVRGPLPRGVRPPGGASGAIGSRTTSIQGAAWQTDNKPIPKAVLRLRNVVTGKIQATTVATDAGNFAFTGVPDGTYLIEMVADGGKVMMVGQTFSVAPGETVATFVRMGPKVPWFNGFFGNAAQTVSSSAASTGVTAVAPEEITPVSSRQ